MSTFEERKSTIGVRKSADRPWRAWLLIGPTVVPFVIWTMVPLLLAVLFSFQRYNLLMPSNGFAGLDNYTFLLSDPDLPRIVVNTLLLVLVPMALTIVFGTLLALLYNEAFPGQPIARLLVIAPFFVMPVVSALIWKNLFMHPVYGLFAWISMQLGLPVVDWFGDWPLTSIIIVITWEWTPLAMLILLTSLQSLDREQMEAAQMDGARGFTRFRFIVLPHLSRSITVLSMIETIFFLGIYAEIAVTTVGGPGTATTNLAFLIYVKAMQGFDAGGASAGGILLMILAMLVTIGLSQLGGRRSAGKSGL